MRFIIGLLIFIISILGYTTYLRKKISCKFEIALPLVFTGIGIVVFLFGILNMLIESTILITIVGIILFVIFIIKKEFNIRSVLNIKYLIYLLILIFLSVVCKEMHLLDYDNFSHWGLICKNLFVNNKFPNFENLVIDFKDYQPGSACFIYYFGFLTGKSEFNMLLAQNILTTSYVFSLFSIIKSKDKLKNIVSYVTILSFYIFFMYFNISISSLMVDTLLASILLFSFVLLYLNKDNLKSAFYYTLPVSIFMFLVKNTGLVLVCINCLALLYIGYRNKKFKKGFKYAILTGFISLSNFYIWSKHVSYAFGSAGLSSKHALSAYNIAKELYHKGISGILKFCSIYFKNFIDILNNIPHLYIISFNIILVILLFIYPKHKKKIKLTLLSINIIYLLYYMALGVMYLLSMPWEEAQRLACFNRYMFTIVAFVFGLVVILIINLINNEKSKTKNIIAGLLITSLSLFATFVFNVKSLDAFIGKQDYKSTPAYEMDKILKTDNFNASSTDWYYVYCEDYIKQGTSQTYLNYMFRYKLNTDKVSIVPTLDNFTYAPEDSIYNRKFIVLTENKKINKFLNSANYKLVSDKIYAFVDNE